MPNLSSLAAAGFPQDKEGLSTQFDVIIPGFSTLTFKSCEGIESEIEVISIPEGGALGAPRTARGAQRVSRITFSKGVVSSGWGSKDSIFKWYLDVCDASKRLEKKTILVSLKSADKKIAEWKLLNAWPCRWVGPFLSHDSSDATVEFVSFAHEGIRAE